MTVLQIDQMVDLRTTFKARILKTYVTELVWMKVLNNLFKKIYFDF